MNTHGYIDNAEHLRDTEWHWMAISAGLIPYDPLPPSPKRIVNENPVEYLHLKDVKTVKKINYKLYNFITTEENIINLYTLKYKVDEIILTLNGKNFNSYEKNYIIDSIKYNTPFFVPEYRDALLFSSSFNGNINLKYQIFKIIFDAGMNVLSFEPMKIDKQTIIENKRLIKNKPFGQNDEFAKKQLGRIGGTKKRRPRKFRRNYSSKKRN